MKVYIAKHFTLENRVKLDCITFKKNVNSKSQYDKYIGEYILLNVKKDNFIQLLNQLKQDKKSLYETPINVKFEKGIGAVIWC